MSQNILNSVVGHVGTVKKLRSLVLQKRVPHAFLFVGSHGQGKKKVALGFAQVLLCEKSNEATACGACATCVSVAKGQNVGLLFLEPEKGVIKIESARAILRQLALTTWGKARVVIIDDAHLMNPQAANALLKSIEEPPAQTYYILMSPSQDSVMKTIRSRSQVVRFKELSVQEKESLLGEPSTADAEFTQVAQNILLSVVQRDSSTAVSHCREQIENRERGLALTQNWLMQVREEWHRGSWGLTREQLAKWSLLILGVERDLVGHCDVQLTLENGINEMTSAL